MDIDIVQSRTLLASLSFSRAAAQKSPLPPNPKEVAAASLVSADVVEVRTQIDGEFAQRVLEDSLLARLDAALKEAGVEESATELLYSGMDTSPQGVAKRIVDFSVGFFAAYQRNHREEESLTQIDGFASLLKKAVEEGFAGAREILSRLGELPGEVEANLEETFALAMKGIDEFAEAQRKSLAERQEEEKAIGAV